MGREKGRAGLARPAGRGDRFWRLSRAAVLRRLECDETGLGAQEARRRLDRYGPNLLHANPDIFRFFKLKIYAESFRGADHLHRILAEAQSIVSAALTAPAQQPGLRPEQV